MHSRCFFLLFSCFLFHCIGVQWFLWYFVLCSSTVLCRKKAACCTFFSGSKKQWRTLHCCELCHWNLYNLLSMPFDAKKKKSKKHHTACGMNLPLYFTLEKSSICQSSCLLTSCMIRWLYGEGSALSNPTAGLSTPKYETKYYMYFVLWGTEFINRFPTGARRYTTAE